jgi:hypothetical protein
MKRPITIIAPATCRTVLFTILIVGIGVGLDAKTWESGATTVTLSHDGTLRVKGKGPMGDNSYRRLWSEDSLSITSVIIEDGVTHIGRRAFQWWFRRITSVTIPGSVKSIGESAFEGCHGLKSIIIPGSVMSIGEKAFSNCGGLKSITISSGVKSIGKQAFWQCADLMFITIPNSMTDIGHGAFDGCTGLTSINVNKNNSAYTSIDGVLFNKAQDTLMRYPIAKQVENF